MAHPAFAMPHVYTGFIVYTLCCNIAIVLSIDIPSPLPIASHIPLLIMISTAVCVICAVVFRQCSSHTHKNLMFRVETFRQHRQLDFPHWLEMAADRMAERMVNGCRLYYTRDEDVKELLQQNWQRWHDDPPPWFTQQYINNIPTHLIPHEDTQTTSTTTTVNGPPLTNTDQ